MTLGAVFYPLATAFQWALVVLLLATGRPTATRVGFAIVLAANGAEALMLALGFPGWAYPLAVADGYIVLTLPFLVSQYPVPLGGPRGARWALALWVAGLAFWTFAVLRGFEALAVDHLIPYTLVHDVPFVLATALLALHLVPRSLALPPSALREQALLLGGALGAGLAYSATSSGLWQVMSASWYLENGLPMPLAHYAVWVGTWAAQLFFALVAVATSALAARRGALVLAAALGLGAVLGLLETSRAAGWTPVGGSSEFVTHAFRPLLLAVALLRHDLFQVPAALRRPLARATAGLFALSLFVLLVAVLSPEGMRTTTLDPAAALGGFAALLVAGYAARRPLVEFFVEDGALGAPGERRARLERYRLALERARSLGGAARAEAEELRRSLRITSVEHDALEAMLAGNLVIPTSALYGAAEGTLVAGRYEVLRELGRGGQGRVLLARDRADQASVVLKEVLRPWEQDAEGRRAALEAEAAAMARVASPHLPRVHGVVHEPWQTYLVREFVPGVDAQRHVAEQGPLAPAEAARVLDDVLAALEALHAQGLLHLDVKPANVVLRPDGRAVLIDQGAARAPRGADVSVTRKRQPAEAAFTVRWAAPEQLRGERADARTDVFQAGGLLYFLLTARPPIAGATDLEVQASVLDGGPLAWPPGTDGALAAVAQRARSPLPATRHPDAAAMRAALREAVAPSVASSRSTGPSPRGHPS